MGRFDIENDIQRAITAFQSEDWIQRWSAAIAIKQMAKEGIDIIPTLPALVNALNDKEINVRGHAALTLDEIIDTYKSVEELNRYQKELENSFGEWRRKQPPEVSVAKVRVQVEISRILVFISHRKAKLSKGELLLGETVKKHKSGKKIYRNLRKQMNQ